MTTEMVTTLLYSLITNESADGHITRLHIVLYDATEAIPRLITNMDQRLADIELT
jgi:hypothetical protein